MSKLRYVAVIIGLIMSYSCSISTKIKTSIPETGSEPIKWKYTQVTVMDAGELDGCEFLLLKENGEQLQPINFPDSLKVNHLKLLITFVEENTNSICMAGRIIRITGVHYFY